MSDGAIQGLTAEQAAAVWQSARELVAWADLVAVSAAKRPKGFSGLGCKAVRQRKTNARKARKARAA